MENIQKLELLHKILKNQSNGIKLTKEINLDSSLEELIQEYTKILEEKIITLQEKIIQDEEEKYQIKADLLYKFYLLEKNGEKLTKHYDMKSDLKEMQFEYELIKKKKDLESEKIKNTKDNKILDKLLEGNMDKFRDLLIGEIWQNFDKSEKMNYLASSIGKIMHSDLINLDLKKLENYVEENKNMDMNENIEDSYDVIKINL